VDEDLQNFMTFWLAGLLKGLESVDKQAQETILRECGIGCAKSYTAQIFQDTRQQSTDLETFLTNLSRRFPEATYTLISPQEIQVTYSHCACDLVAHGFTQSPMLCRCSAANLQANFAQALELPVEVAIRSSILRGNTNCTFVVSFTEAIERVF
jgi:hypothetical protein